MSLNVNRPSSPLYNGGPFMDGTYTTSSALTGQAATIPDYSTAIATMMEGYSEGSLTLQQETATSAQPLTALHEKTVADIAAASTPQAVVEADELGTAKAAATTNEITRHSALIGAKIGANSEKMKAIREAFEAQVLAAIKTSQTISTSTMTANKALFSEQMAHQAELQAQINNGGVPVKDSLQTLGVGNSAGGAGAGGNPGAGGNQGEGGNPGAGGNQSAGGLDVGGWT